VSGLKPKLASYVLGKNPSNVTSAIHDARIAEMSDSAASDTSHLADQMSEMRKDIQKMTERYDTMTLSASVQRERSKSPARTITFREPEMTQETRRNYSYASRGQGRGNYRRSQFCGRGRGPVALDCPRILHSILPNNTQTKLQGKLPLTAEQNAPNVDWLDTATSCSVQPTINNAISVDDSVTSRDAAVRPSWSDVAQRPALTGTGAGKLAH